MESITTTMTTMSSVSQSQQPQLESPRPMTPLSPIIQATTAFDHQPAKLGRRHKLLQGLQRMSSSPSLVKLGRTGSTEKVSKSSQKASLSCVSPNAPASTFSLPPHLSYPFSNGFSTAPTT